MRKVKCVVPVSGGKDSQACLQLAVKEFGAENVIGLFCDTQFEHELTYKHVKHMAELYGVEIITRCEGEVLDLCRKYKRFPSGTARFCTDALKINVSKKFYKQLAEQQGEGFEVWYGMRSAESHERAKRYEDKIDTETYAPHEVSYAVKLPKVSRQDGRSFQNANHRMDSWRSLRVFSRQ